MHALLLAVVMTFATTAALPFEGTLGPKPVRDPTFSDRLNAFVWRNWFCVSKERLALTAGASVRALTDVAVEMGLPADPIVEPEWRDKGYVTVLRRNWQLLPYDQIMTLLGWDRERLRFHLLEDDYLLQKLGNLKPSCPALVCGKTEIEAGRPERTRIAAILKAERIDAGRSSEPRFAFVRELTAPLLDDGESWHPNASTSPFDTRLLFSYFADYADPLLDDEVGSFPDGLLARCARQGVNAVWVHVVLRTLARDPFFVEFGDGAERRQSNLKKLVNRAARHGIKVFLYLNEPRPMPCAFFEKNADYCSCRGTLEWRGMTNAMCTQAPEVRRWLRNAVETVFRSAPGLGGIIVINSSENLVTCVSHGDKKVYENDPSGNCRPDKFCAVCQRLPVAEVLADDARLLIEGMHRADPSAKAIFWDWGWKPGLSLAHDLLRRLPTRNVSFMTMSERGLRLDVEGIPAVVNEYAVSQVGPSEIAIAKWNVAKRFGLGLAVKAQVSGSWEMAAVPYVPVLDSVARHSWNLMKSGVRDAMLSWSCGCYPSPNLRVFTGVRTTDVGPEDVLRRYSEETYGVEAASIAREVWADLSRAFSLYPFDRKTLHHGPHHWGPANPLYAQKSGYRASMVGIPYDDIDSWRSIFPTNVYVSRCQKVADSFAAAAMRWNDVVGACRDGAHRLAERELGIIRAVSLHMASCADQVRFVQARDRGDVSEMKAIARRELIRAKALLPLVECDSRLGYECSCHYFYTPQDLREKIVNCRKIIDNDNLIPSL